MSPNPPRSSEFPSTSARVHSDLFADDEAIGDKLADGLAGVGVGNFRGLVGVEQDFAFAATNDGGCEALLRAEVHPVKGRWLSATSG